MKTVLLGDRPAALDAWIERRRRLGLDLFDEVWEGVLHMAPAPRRSHGRLVEEIAAALRRPARRAGLFGLGPFNLGAVENFRVPDYGYDRAEGDEVWVPTAAIVVEVVSPDDETYEKFDFYFAHGVEELVVADPAERTVRWWRRGSGAFEPTDRSDLLDLTVDEVTAAIDWP